MCVGNSQIPQKHFIRPGANAQKMPLEWRGSTHCYTAPNGDGLIPAPPAPMEVMLQEEVVSRIEVVITVRIVMVRTAPPFTAIDHLRTRWGREAEGSRGGQRYSDFSQHDSLLVHRSKCFAR